MDPAQKLVVGGIVTALAIVGIFKYLNHISQPKDNRKKKYDPSRSHYSYTNEANNKGWIIVALIILVVVVLVAALAGNVISNGFAPLTK